MSMTIRLPKDGRCVTNLMDRRSAHGEFEQDHPFGVHGNREFHENFPRSSGSFAVPVTGIVAGKPRCINRNPRDVGIRRKRCLSKVMDHLRKKSGRYPFQKILQGPIMGNRPQHEEMTALGHETDEIKGIVSFQPLTPTM